MRQGLRPTGDAPRWTFGEESRRPGPVARSLSWLVLAALLLALLVAAATFEPLRWPSVVGDEASYLMAAQSLAYDLDFRYQAEDLERFRSHYQRQPQGLILQSPDGGASLIYGKPLFYPVYLAPFVRLWPRQGAAIANSLLLSLASLLAAGALERSVGGAAPLWVAAFVFSSVAFVYTFWAHSDLFLLSLVAISLSILVLRRGEQRAELFRRSAWRWLPWTIAAALLGVVTLSRPFYCFLFLPLLVAAGSERRGRAAVTAFVAMLLLGLGATFAIQGAWTPYAGERQGYYEHTGFPHDPVAPPRQEQRRWQERLESGGDNAWVGARLFPFGFDLRVTVHNLKYFAIGRHVGALPYFLPLILGILAFRGDGFRWSLVLALLAILSLFLLSRPFNFWGGGGAVANRYLLPVYPVFWFLVGRRRSLGWVLAVSALSALFLWPSWSSPRGYLRAEDRSYRHVSWFAERFLPYETTQSHLKPAGREDFHHGDSEAGSIWVKPLSPRFDERDGWISLAAGEHTAELLIGFEAPLERLDLIRGVAVPGRGREVDRGAAGAREPGVREPGDQEPEADETGAEPASGPDRSSVGWRLEEEGSQRVELRRPAARHRMWWSRDRFYLYRIDVEELVTPSGDALSWFRLAPVSE